MDGLPGPATDARMQAVSGNIMARQWPDAPLSEPEKCLLISGIVIESSERPTTVVGWSSSGKSRIKSLVAMVFAVMESSRKGRRVPVRAL